MILLDTDHVSTLEDSRSSRRERLLARMALAADMFGTTIITVEEQMRGWLASITKERHASRQVFAYDRLGRLFAFFAPWSIATFDASAAAHFDTLNRVKIRVADRKIAAIAITQSALLLSANRRDFEQVPGLRFENWMDGPTAEG